MSQLRQFWHGPSFIHAILRNWIDAFSVSWWKQPVDRPKEYRGGVFEVANYTEAINQIEIRMLNVIVQTQKCMHTEGKAVEYHCPANHKTQLHM